MNLDIFSPKAPPLFGLDISSSSVKMLEIVEVGKGAYRVERYVIEPLPRDATVDGNISNLESVVETVRRGYKRMGTRAKHVAMAVPTGAVITKAQAMEMCRKPQVPIEAFTIDQVVVRPFGDTAVVTGRTTVTTGDASPETLRLRFTDVFVRRAGRWQVVASHATRVAP